MTHTLHREGSIGSLKNDYCLLITPCKGYNNIQAEKRIIKAVNIIYEVGPTNFRIYRVPRKGVFNLPITKEKIEDYKSRVYDNTKIRCVFNDKNKVKEAIKRIKEAELGLSVVVTGIRKDVEGMCKKLNIQPHSINIAMGTYGKKELLPDSNFRKITTMCGHGIVAPELVRGLIRKIKKGEISYEKAGVELAKPCICGVFNQERATEILKEIISDYDDEGKRQYLND